MASLLLKICLQEIKTLYSYYRAVGKTIYLASLNNSILKPLTIFADYKGVYKIADIKEKLKETRENITPKIKARATLGLIPMNPIFSQL